MIDCTSTAMSVNSASRSASGTLTCPGFDSTLGTLITVADLGPGAPPSGTAAFRLQNNAAEVFDGGVTVFGFVLSVRLADGRFGPDQGLGSGPGFGSSAPIQPGESGEINGDLWLLSSVYRYPASSFSLFHGPGPVTIGVRLEYLSDAPGNRPAGVDLDSFSATGFWNTKLVYDYTPVPEPAAWLSMLAGAVAIATLRKR